ncbi:MAG TPA: YceI family protein [Kofleriaceae bacterium]|jgi:polyisoprenoid-binding protein YceI
MKLITSAFLIAGLVLGTACKKKEEPAPTPAAGSGSAVADKGSDTGSAKAPEPTPAPALTIPDPDTSADNITVYSHHQKPKPIDPVKLKFETFKVVSADFDPKKIEGGKATIQIDLSSFKTDSDKRDAHVKSESYLDVAKFATATIKVDNVKVKAGDTYTADATVEAHGASKTYPVEFDVIDKKDDSIRIKGVEKFSRLDFSIGTDPAANAEEAVGSDLTIQVVLTLKKT